jgi:hypothetical protein
MGSFGLAIIGLLGVEKELAGLYMPCWVVSPTNSCAANWTRLSWVPLSAEGPLCGAIGIWDGHAVKELMAMGLKEGCMSPELYSACVAMLSSRSYGVWYPDIRWSFVSRLMIDLAAGDAVDMSMSLRFISKRVFRSSWGTEFSDSISSWPYLDMAASRSSWGSLRKSSSAFVRIMDRLGTNLALNWVRISLSGL